MANNEDVNQVNQGAPAADIPDLKKKEKERKKAGAAWSGAKPGGSFSGATGGAGGAGGTVARAAASAASSAGGAAGVGAAEAGGAGWLSSFLSSLTGGGGGWLSSMVARLTATMFGKMILAAGVAMFVAGAGLMGYALLAGGGADGTGAIGDLGALSSSMKVRFGGGDRTGYIASNGEIMFDPIKAAKDKKAAEEKAPEDKTAEEPVPDQTADAGKADWNRPGLEHNLSGSKLSTSLGGGFGSKNIFAGNSAAPKLNESIGKINIPSGQKGRLSSARRAANARVSTGGRGRAAKSNKAFGQLKVAKGMSALGAGTSSAEGARSTAAGAFDGQTAGTGNVEGTAGSGSFTNGDVDTPSTPGGAPDVTVPDVDVPDGVAADPNTTATLAGIGSMAKKAGEMKKKAAQLMMQGLALIVAGAALIAMASGPWAPIVIAIGAMLIGLGGMLIGMSMMMSNMAEMMKGMADTMSQSLAARTNDVKQDQINQYCIDKAYNEGTDPANCNPPDSVTENTQVLHNDSEAVQEHKDMVNENGQVQVDGDPAQKTE